MKKGSSLNKIVKKIMAIPFAKTVSLVVAFSLVSFICFWLIKIVLGLDVDSDFGVDVDSDAAPTVIMISIMVIFEGAVMIFHSFYDEKIKLKYFKIRKRHKDYVELCEKEYEKIKPYHEKYRNFIKYFGLNNSKIDTLSDTDWDMSPGDILQKFFIIQNQEEFMNQVDDILRYLTMKEEFYHVVSGLAITIEESFSDGEKKVCPSLEIASDLIGAGKYFFRLDEFTVIDRNDGESKLTVKITKDALLELKNNLLKPQAADDKQT